MFAASPILYFALALDHSSPANDSGENEARPLPYTGSSNGQPTYRPPETAEPVAVPGPPQETWVHQPFMRWRQRNRDRSPWTGDIKGIGAEFLIHSFYGEGLFGTANELRLNLTLSRNFTVHTGLMIPGPHYNFGFTFFRDLALPMFDMGEMSTVGFLTPAIDLNVYLDFVPTPISATSAAFSLSPRIGGLRWVRSKRLAVDIAASAGELWYRVPQAASTVSWTFQVAVAGIY